MMNSIRHFFSRKIVRQSCWALLLLLGVTITGAVTFFIFVYNGGFGNIPNQSDLEKIRNYTASEIYSSDSVLLGRYFLENRSNVAFEKVPEHLINALIATEDVRFFAHEGVDHVSLFRVLFKSVLLRNKSAGGGSTISQQLAKNLFGRKNHGKLTYPVNKLKEIIIASRLEEVYSKKEILVMYLNTVSFGENTYGIETAAELFFGKTTEQLKAHQSAMLVGMLKSPTIFNPRLHPQAALERRNTVITQMIKYNTITESESDSLKTLSLDLHYSPNNQNAGIASYFREQLRNEVASWIDEYNKDKGTEINLYTDGLKIYTTIHSKLQRFAEKAVNQHLSSLQTELQKEKNISRIVNGKSKLVDLLIKMSDRYKHDVTNKNEIPHSFYEKTQMKIWDWKGEHDTLLTPLDSIKHYLRFLNCGFYCIDNFSGKVLCWVGGIHPAVFKYDHVLAKRQVGSTIKPIVYLTALENGRNPCDMIKNEKTSYDQYGGWTPENSNNEYGGFYSMKGALTNSINTISAKLIIETGPDKVIAKAKQMGIRSDLPAVPSLALGTANASLKEMVNAYSVFANRGEYKEAYYLEKIIDNHDLVLFSNKPSKRTQAANTLNAQEIHLMLEHVVNAGTAASIRSKYKLSIPAAGKTGTTQNGSDGWFIGYTPKMVAGCWVGGEYPIVRFSNQSIAQGARLALPVWAYFMQQVNTDKELQHYSSGQFKISDEARNLLNCPDKKEETFWDNLFGRKERKNEKAVDKNKPTAGSKQTEKKKSFWNFLKRSK